MAEKNTKYDFAVCLSHDIDRIYKTYQYVFEAIVERNPWHLVDLFSKNNPYWTFGNLMAIEDDLGVRSSIHVLDEIPLSERPKREWFSKTGWRLFGGRYDITDDRVRSILRVLDKFGWEIALHGSYTSIQNPERFAYEKQRIESVADTKIIGNRQHYWRLERPETWEKLHDIGIKYDLSLGSSDKVGFQHGYNLIRPFNNDFVVFPWSMMDGALMNSTDSVTDAIEIGIQVLQDTKSHEGVLVLDWHGGGVFNEEERPGWATVYQRLIEEALSMGAWVGPPGELYQSLDHPEGKIPDALEKMS